MSTIGPENIVNSWLPLLVIGLPLVSSVLIYGLEKRVLHLGKSLSLFVSLLSLGLLLSLYQAIRAGKVVSAGPLSLLPPLGLSFRLDALAFLYSLVILVVWSLVIGYSLSYMSRYPHQARFFGVMVLTLGGCLGVGMAADLFTLFVFFELISFSAYVLIVHDETPQTMSAGFKYLVMSITGSLALFFGVIATYEMAGTLSLTSWGFLRQESGLTLGVFIAFLVGFGIKAGMFPLHVWLPDAHPVAPTPASAVLSGLMIKAGAFGIMRVFLNVFGPQFLRKTPWPHVLLWGAVASMILGSGVAILQDDLKRRLAYSSIGQMGYILAGIGLLTRSSIAGSAFHIFSHAIAKACLFLAVGAITLATGKKEVSSLAGLGRKLPLTFGAVTMASLSMIGIPPFNGFVSKWSLSVGALDAGRPEIVIFLLVSSMMACVYCLPIVITAFFGGQREDQAPGERQEPPLGMLLPIVALAIGSVLFSLVPESPALVLTELWARSLPVP